MAGKGSKEKRKKRTAKGGSSTRSSSPRRSLNAELGDTPPRARDERPVTSGGLLTGMRRTIQGGTPDPGGEKGFFTKRRGLVEWAVWGAVAVAIFLWWRGRAG